MLVSILHRITGGALSIVGLVLLTWWLVALTGDADGYSILNFVVTHPVGRVLLIGLTWAFFQHLLSGIRHLAMDTGQAFELGVNKTSAILTIILSILLTAAVWGRLLGAY